MKRMIGLLMLAGLVVGVVGISGCGADSPAAMSVVCRQVADEHWDVDRYIAWASMGRRDHFIHFALPCSTYALTGSLSDCPGAKKQQYYELIGKYDQFVSGWSDVQDSTGRQVQVWDIDNPGDYDSQNRLAYESCRAGN